MAAFTINVFTPSTGSRKGQAIKTVMFGDNPTPQRNEHLGAKLAGMILPLLDNPAFREALQAVATQHDKPAPVKVEAPEKPVKVESVRDGSGAEAIRKAEADRKAKVERQTAAKVEANADKRAELIERGVKLGMPAIQAYGLKMDLAKLQSKVEAATPKPAPIPTVPTVKPSRKVQTRAIGEDGNFYTLYSDGSFAIEQPSKRAA